MLASSRNCDAQVIERSNGSRFLRIFNEDRVLDLKDTQLLEETIRRHEKLLEEAKWALDYLNGCQEIPFG